MGAPRLAMAASEEVQRGAYLPGKTATHSGKILYPQCKKVGSEAGGVDVAGGSGPPSPI
jgi:hypothetical protein